MDQKLSELVEQLTTSGESELNSEKIKELKKICRASDEHIGHVYHLLMTQLNEDHAEIRFSAFQVVVELFTRSHQFRTLLISNFQEFLELTVETDYDQPLPPPKEVAQKLKKLAIKSVQEWHEKYGDAYKKLSLGYHFLKQNKKVDFQDMTARTLAERKREEEKQRRLENIYKEKAKQAEEEMKEMLEEIQANLTEMENCFKLLMPDPFDFSVNGVAIESELERTEDKAKASSFQAEKEMDLQAPIPDTFDDEQPCCSKDLPPVPLNQRTGESGISSTSEYQEEDGKGLSERECEADDTNEDDSFIRKHGLGSHTYSLNLEISTDLNVCENEDNSAVVTNLLDICRLIKNKFCPSVQSWIQLFTKAGVNDDRLRHAIDVKRQLEMALKKHEALKIECKQRERKVMKASDEEDDDDFVEVPEKEGFEPHIPDHLRKEYGLEPLASPQTTKKLDTVKPAGSNLPKRSKTYDEELDPTCAAATWKLIKHKLPKLSPISGSVLGSPEPDASVECINMQKKHEEDRAKAPVMPFGIDLYYWGQDQPTSGKILKFSSQHRFWTPNELEEEVENKEMAAMLKTRYITFPGKFEPVKHKCRAPMPNGSLCERQDRFKCPFHGKVIPRDELGNPTNPEDKAREEKQKFEKQAEEQDWRDTEFMREIEAATGVDLGSSKITGKGKGKKKKYPNLTDLKQHTNTSRTRLQKKVFNKAAVKRVVSAMNRVDQKKHEKFANQFNYALN
nr:UV-stimulated scaffold protein A isoform X1 [Geotrypetes seraphini]XP_033807139.1 UV-stimulated scaffold protein A isoform X1 [Geotrypetes seraphini]XP_033807150.1 UV-stimulated scaffold protein A isoform X1 [Geotrypetes seraphini]XP_033807158.1 UV-stimulated scaffold protein A isoform X1 [Geotrypetes seraphini]XP_033807166.1 UV-stimulated scaffold protein A isoform X1 [Geotrypetes seraphini]XP_033807174.1 UV-stimulated scaffold protein A isoform X1 [Geotrypetes seraphini]XP_033807182.1 UV